MLSYKYIIDTQQHGVSDDYIARVCVWHNVYGDKTVMFYFSEMPTEAQIITEANRYITNINTISANG